MSATSLSPSSLPSIHQEFEAALPKMDQAFDFHFRGLRSQERQEAAAEARAAAWVAWHSLLRRGKDPLEVGPVGVANTCALHIKGRYNAGRQAVRPSGVDALGRALQARGFHIVSFDQDVNERGDLWRDWIAEDTRWTPADQVAFTLDFEDWLERLPKRKRETAQLLAEGHETGVVAQMLGVTPGAVSQSRSWLANHWRKFQGETSARGRYGTRSRAGSNGGQRPTIAWPSRTHDRAACSLRP
jgi:hypothetical protein